MESPHLYDTIEYKKGAINMKTKLYGDVSDYEINNELASNEVSLNLQNLINDQHNPSMADQHSMMQESLCLGLECLNVDKSLPNVNCPRGIGANPGLGCLTSPAIANNNMYNTLAYVPQAVHGGSQFDHQYPDEQLQIKEEPSESARDARREYASCARMNNYSGYSGYPLTPTVVPGADGGLLKSPHKSPTALMKGGTPKKSGTNDEYRRRRERNNIAVRKSREKAKARTRETEERVKMLTDENRSLQEECKTLQQQLSFFKSVFTSLQLECLPEPYQTDMRNTIEKLSNHPQHQLMGI